MTKNRNLALAAVAALLVTMSPALAAEGHGSTGGQGMSMPGMDMKGMHEEMEKRMADTSAFGEKGDPAKASRTIKIVAEDIKFSMTDERVSLGETVTFSVTNKGEQPHEFTIGDAAYQDYVRKMMTHMAEMGMDMASPEHAAMHAAVGNSVVVAPGETKSVTWRFSKAGSFLFACNVPGHSEAGMQGTIEVK